MRVCSIDSRSEYVQFGKQNLASGTQSIALLKITCKRSTKKFQTSNSVSKWLQRYACKCSVAQIFECNTSLGNYKQLVGPARMIYVASGSGREYLLCGPDLCNYLKTFLIFLSYLKIKKPSFTSKVTLRGPV